MRRKKYLIILVLAGLLLAVFSCKKREEGIPGKQPVGEVILTDSANPGFGGEKAFDKDAIGTFWETSKPFPHWIQYNFFSSKQITQYALQTGPHGKDATERMPTDWEFQGSNDRSNWTTLDIRKNQIDWKNDEERIYKLTNPNPYKYYRLYITAGMDPDILRLYEVKMME